MYLNFPERIGHHCLSTSKTHTHTNTHTHQVCKLPVVIKCF